MTQLLYGAPVAEKLFIQTRALIQKNAISGYLAIFVMGENNPSLVYVRKKKEYAENLWLTTKIFSHEETVREDIQYCNNDDACLWIIIQLPLPLSLQKHQRELLDAVLPQKDPDCLGENALLLPATPAAILHILSHYNYTDFANKKIAVLGESDLIWKPLAKELIKRWWDVYIFNEFSDQQYMRRVCQQSDYIMACTGSLHLVDETFLAGEEWGILSDVDGFSQPISQIIVDAWRGMLDGKAAGDVYTDAVIWKVKALTPVPWGVWPVTVASLFWNMIQLCTAST